MKLYEVVHEYRTQLDALAELDLDAQTYADTLESMDGDLKDKLRAVIAYGRNLRAAQAAQEAAAKGMAQRAASTGTQADWMFDYALRAMEATGITEVSTDEWAAKVAKSPPKVVIADDAMIPAQYIRTKVTTEPDKTALKAALQAGDVLPGVSLVSGHRLALR